MTSRRAFLRKAAGAAAGAMGALYLGHGNRSQAGSPSSAPTEPRFNILFIAADDLRPQLGCYGDQVVRSPQIDRLAARGTLFVHAYCQQALCSPSRISLLSGRYPSTTQIFGIGPALRETLPDIVTLPQQFKNNGYFTRSLGKIYHPGIDDAPSWSIPTWMPKKTPYGPEGEAMVRQYRDKMKAAGKVIPTKGIGAAIFAGPAFESPEVPDELLADGELAGKAVAALRELASKPEQPFFLGVGFHSPHLPWVAPKKYWDLINPADIPLPDNPYPPRNAPDFAARSGDDFYQYCNVPKDRKITPEFGRRCLHGYLAAIGYLDALVGRLLETLSETGLSRNTVVILWGDQGYYMGEHGWWGSKHNNYEGATRVPLIIAVPGQKNPGARCEAFVELVDIYPSLLDICGLPMPSGLEGRSFRPLIDNPRDSFKTAAFSWYLKGGYLGIAMRMNRWRFVEWLKTGSPEVYELYDHQDDPQENENLAQKSEYRALIQELSVRLRAHVKSLPRGRSAQPL